MGLNDKSDDGTTIDVRNSFNQTGELGGFGSETRTTSLTTVEIQSPYKTTTYWVFGSAESDNKTQGYSRLNHSKEKRKHEICISIMLYLFALFWNALLVVHVISRYSLNIWASFNSFFPMVSVGLSGISLVVIVSNMVNYCVQFNYRINTILFWIAVFCGVASPLVFILCLPLYVVKVS